jgi:hypothetical protein
MHATLQAFVDDYRARGVPPPHILLVGRDDHKNISIAREFADKLGAGYAITDAADVSIQGDVTAMLSNKKAAILTDVQKLKRPMVDLISEILVSGEVKISIGLGPATRVHVLELVTVAFIATSPAKQECPAALLKQFRCVIPVEPYTQEELAGMLESEAWKDGISLEPAAAELLLRCSNDSATTLLNRFRKVAAQVDQKTNRPVFTFDEVATALARLRIEMPRHSPIPTLFNIDALTGQQFESLMKALLIEMGFQAELTEVTGDGGIDIIAMLDKPFCGGRYIFQCKRYAGHNIVGSPAIRDFYGAVTADRAVKGIFVTTSEFSAQAKEFAAQVGIELVNRTKLVQLLQEYKVISV